MLKVLTISTYDVSGGAGKAAYRLHHALLNAGVDSQMLVLHKRSHDKSVIGTQGLLQFSFKLHNYLSKTELKKYDSVSKGLFTNSLDVRIPSLISKINAQAPDIVHLHWTCHGMLNIEHIAQINSPIVWSLHDMWAFTGGCHYDLNCNRYLNICGSCKVLDSSEEIDVSTRLQERKLKSFPQISNLTVVGLSNWIASCSSASSIMKGRNTTVLPNPIDLQTYKAFDKNEARRILNLPLQKKLILFGAMDSTTDLRKGFLHLTNALRLLKDINAEVVIFGSNKPSETPDFPQNAHYLGLVNDETTLALTYSACDVMVVPSIQENLSNTIMESLSCATPVVAFNLGGNSDLIDHQENGFLVDDIDAQGMAHGIRWIIEHGTPKFLCDNARAKAEKYFEQSKVAKDYIKLYKSILNT